MGLDPNNLPNHFRDKMAEEYRRDIHDARVAKVPGKFIGDRGFHLFITPVPAPRMTRRDKWLKPRRVCVQRYFDFRAEIQKAIGDLPIVPDAIHCVFRIPMPDSWSANKRAGMIGKPHRQRPDCDNLHKAIQDALFLEDGAIWDASQKKFWAERGSLEIKMIWTQAR